MLSQFNSNACNKFPGKTYICSRLVADSACGVNGWCLTTVYLWQIRNAVGVCCSQRYCIIGYNQSTGKSVCPMLRDDDLWLPRRGLEPRCAALSWYAFFQSARSTILDHQSPSESICVAHRHEILTIDLWLNSVDVDLVGSRGIRNFDKTDILQSFFVHLFFEFSESKGLIRAVRSGYGLEWKISEASVQPSRRFRSRLWSLHGDVRSLRLPDGTEEVSGVHDGR